MNRSARRLFFAAALALAGFGLAHKAAAQSASEYPAHAVKVIVPFSPAGPTDIIARMIAQKLSESLGKQFYVENIAHAGGNTGMGIAAKAAPDGYTILVHGSNFIVNPSLYATIPFDPYRDFAPDRERRRARSPARRGRRAAPAGGRLYRTHRLRGR